MDIKLELLKSSIAELVTSNIENLNIDVNQIADTVAISMLREILSIVRDDSLSDFEIVERIITIFENKDISTGLCHDF